MGRIIYKICDAALWAEAERARTFSGAGIDIADGYIHFSTAGQAQETADKHFAGRGGLVLVAVDTGSLGPSLKWEPSRGGALFPHLYGTLSLDHVLWVKPLQLAENGRHIFPELDP